MYTILPFTISLTDLFKKSSHSLDGEQGGLL